jgi:hypothetical protein
MCVESAPRSPRDLQRVRTRQRTCKRHVDRWSISRVIATVTPGREQPSREPLGVAQGRNRGGCSRPHHLARCCEPVSRTAQSAVRCAIVALRAICSQRGAYACVSHLGACAVTTSNRTSSVATVDANHRLMSRPPSRRQQFDPRRVSQGGDRRFVGPMSDGARRTREPFTECCDRPAKTP